MATHTLINPRFYASTSRPKLVGGHEDLTIKETAAQAWAIGALIYEDTNGTLAICTNSSSKVDSAIAGQALKAASGVTGGNVFFRAIRSCDVYMMNVYHTTPASAVTAQTDIGLVYGIFYNTSATLTTGSNSKFVVDKLNTTTEDGSTALAKVQVVGFPRTSPVDGSLNTIGDIYGFVFVRFLPFTIASDGSPFTRNLQYDLL